MMKGLEDIQEQIDEKETESDESDIDERNEKDSARQQHHSDIKSMVVKFVRIHVRICSEK